MSLLQIFGDLFFIWGIKQYAAVFAGDPEDNPSIGIILCKTRYRIIAEYALRDMNKPIGISEYLLMENVPEKYQSSLPTTEEIEAELSWDEVENDNQQI